MSNKEKILKKQVDAINKHFIDNEIMTKKQYAEISSLFILEVISNLIKK